MTRDGGDLLIDTATAAGAWVVITEPAWDGWRIYIDDRRVEHFYANAAFIGVYVPSGGHRIRLTFLPKSFVRGRAISLSTLALLLGGGIAVRIRRRRCNAGVTGDTIRGAAGRTIPEPLHRERPLDANPRSVIDRFLSGRGHLAAGHHLHRSDRSRPGETRRGDRHRYGGRVAFGNARRRTHRDGGDDWRSTKF